MRTAALSLAELLTYYDRYTVPEFQRVYGWRETELDRLFSDFQTAMLGRQRASSSAPFIWLHPEARARL
jgi:uncharacterized protein with ParB-like and HNH nuclease domain